MSAPADHVERRRRRPFEGGVGARHPDRLHVVEPLHLVFLGRGVAAALLGEHVDDDRPLPLRRVGEGLLHLGDVVAVDRPGVAHAQGLEEDVGGHDLAQRAGQAEDPGGGQLADGGDVADPAADPLAGLHVGPVQPQAGQALGELGDRRRVGAAVVVEHDHDPAARVARGC